MLRKVTVVVLSLMLIGSSLVFAGPAQDVLGDLAAEAQSSRLISGYVLIGAGVVAGVAGTLLLAPLDLAWVGPLVGGVIAVPGVIALLSPSEAEQEAAAAETEEAAVIALHRLAESGQRARFISGIVNLASGVASLVFPYSFVTAYDYVYSAVLSFGMAALDFLLPSQEEQALAHYELLIAPSPLP